MLRVPPVTILAQEMRSKFFGGRSSFVESATAASHDFGARSAIENDQALEMLRVSLVTVLAREMRLKFFEFFGNRPSFGEGASAAGHDVGARNAIENANSFFSSHQSQF